MFLNQRFWESKPIGKFGRWQDLDFIPSPQGKFGLDPPWRKGQGYNLAVWIFGQSVQNAFRKQTHSKISLWQDLDLKSSLQG